ncbi:MAG: TerC family protein [Planctomycetota bacterium]
MNVPTIATPEMWAGFMLFVLGMLALDLGVFHRNAHTVSFKEALGWTGVWIALAAVFNFGIYTWFGEAKALEFGTGYVIEKALSIDNIFVIVLIFSYFSVPAEHQHRVLFWGILGALVMRAIFIGVGAALLAKFHWLIYVFGGFLVLTGIKMLIKDETSKPMDQTPAYRFFKRLVPTTSTYDGAKLFTRQNGIRMATPLFMVLLLVEFTDLIFAVDSIPAIFAVTSDPFIVFTSNIFALFGLRSLFFLLAGSMNKFHFLKVGLALVLVFVGVKMSIAEFYKIDTLYSLLVVAMLIGTSIAASLMWPQAETKSDADSLQPQANPVL